MRKLVPLCLAAMLLAVICIPALGAEASGTCGENLTWSLENGVLTISGQGAMEDYQEITPPWQGYRDEITSLVLTGGVTTVGAQAFENYDNLKSVDLGDSLTQLNYRAFADCDGLTSLSLPRTFTSFEEECLRSCKNLTEIHCEGGFPHFRQNCLWDTVTKIYFPASRPWGVKYIQQLEEAFHGRIEFLASDGTDPYTPTEATQPETTEAPTEVTTEATTEAATEATTRPATEATTQPTTAPTTAPTTQPQTYPTASETAASPTQESSGVEAGGVVMGILVFLVLTFLGIGGLLFAAGKRRR